MEAISQSPSPFLSFRAQPRNQREAIQCLNARACDEPFEQRIAPC